MLKSIAKVWITEDGALVRNGHPDARVLFAREGQMISEAQLSKFAPAPQFFCCADGRKTAGNEQGSSLKPVHMQKGNDTAKGAKKG